MAVNWADNVEETTTSTGIGTIDLAGATAGNQTFVAGLGTGSACYYCISSNSEYEVGYGTVTDAATDTLSRDSVLASSNGDALVSFSSGTKNVHLLPPFALRATRILDRDRDTRVDTDEGFADQDTIRFDAAGSEMATITANGLALPNGARIDEFSTDGTLAGNSDISVPTERAVKTYVDQLTFDEIKDADGNTRIQVEESVNENIIRFDTNGTERMIVGAGGLVAIGDTANPNMTVGLTINQNGNDDEIFALKSSDVAHGITAQTGTDSHGFAEKYDANEGALHLVGLGEGGEGAVITGMSTVPNTDDTNASVGAVTIRGAQKSGTGVTTMSAAQNVVSIDAWGTTLALFKGDGTVHAVDTSWATAADTEDDIKALRMLDLAQSTKGIMESAWDSMIGDDWEYLQKIGVAGSTNP